MAETRRTGYEEEMSNSQLATVKRNYRLLFLLKSVLGIVLLVQGGLAVSYMQGQKNTFGPPYYLGAFLVGCPMVISGMLDFFIFRFLTSNNQLVIQLKRYACFECGMSIISVFGGFIGIFFVSLFGIQECDPSSFFSHCNYTLNISSNRRLAVGILVSLIISVIVCIVGTVMNCRSYNGLAPGTLLKARSQGFTARQNVYVAGRNGNAVIASTVPEQSPMFGGFNHRRNENYSADSQIIVGGHVINKDRGGFSGAIIHAPPENTTVHPTVGYYPQNQGATNQFQQVNQSDSVNQLQEQNRLLREQIMLQQQQLQLIQQQQQQQQQHEPLPSDPPSYESCLQDPSQLKFLQQQNAELQHQYQTQQNQISEKMPASSGTYPEPSAPPM